MSSTSISGSSGNQSIASTPISSAPASPANRRHFSRPSEDTKNKLFGPPEQNNIQRKAKTCAKSFMFDYDHPVTKSMTHKKHIAVVRRNPITGEVYDDTYSGGADKYTANGTGSLSLPSTPVKMRQINTAKLSTIFY